MYFEGSELFCCSFLIQKYHWSYAIWTRGIDVLFKDEGMQLLNLGWREKEKERKGLQTPQMCFFVLHSFSGIIEVEVIFFFFFLFWEENSEALSRVDQRRPGWREAGFLLLREKDKEGGKMEGKKEKGKKDIPTRKL